MSNNKKFLKRTVAAFLAAVNIFNFAGGSGKAADPWDILMKGSNEQANENEVKNVYYLKDFLDSLEGIDFEKNVQTLLSNNKLKSLKKIGDFSNLYQLKGEGVLLIDFADMFIKMGTIKNALNEENITKLLKDKKNVIYKIEASACTNRNFIKQTLKYIENINFIDVDDIKNLKEFCKNFKEKKDLEKKLNEANQKVQDAEAAKNMAEKEKKELKEKEELQSELRGKEEKLETEKDEKDKLQDKLNNIKGKLDKVNGLKGSSEIEKVQKLCENYLKLKDEKEKLTKNSGSGMWKSFAVTGWLGTLLGLGYIFKEELKDAYHVAYDKVLALKNKMLNK